MWRSGEAISSSNASIFKASLGRQLNDKRSILILHTWYPALASVQVRRCCCTLSSGYLYPSHHFTDDTENCTEPSHAPCCATSIWKLSAFVVTLCITKDLRNSLWVINKRSWGIEGGKIIRSCTVQPWVRLAFSNPCRFSSDTLLCPFSVPQACG